MTNVTPFPVGLSDGLVEVLADELDAAGDGNHAPVLWRFLPPYVARWRSAGVPEDTVNAEVSRICAAAAMAVALREVQREAAAEGDGEVPA